MFLEEKLKLLKTFQAGDLITISIKCTSNSNFFPATKLCIKKVIFIKVNDMVSDHVYIKFGYLSIKILDKNKIKDYCITQTDILDIISRAT